LRFRPDTDYFGALHLLDSCWRHATLETHSPHRGNTADLISGSISAGSLARSQKKHQGAQITNFSLQQKCTWFRCFLATTAADDVFPATECYSEAVDKPLSSLHIDLLAYAELICCPFFSSGLNAPQDGACGAYTIQQRQGNRLDHQICSQTFVARTGKPKKATNQVQGWAVNSPRDLLFICRRPGVAANKICSILRPTAILRQQGRCRNTALRTSKWRCAW
jgi:hypothetical protein